MWNERIREDFGRNKRSREKFVVGHEVLFALGATGMASEIGGIIRSHMDDVPDNNDGWIPVSEKLPEENDGKYYPMLNVSTSYKELLSGAFIELEIRNGIFIVKCITSL